MAEANGKRPAGDMNAPAKSEATDSFDTAKAKKIAALKLHAEELEVEIEKVKAKLAEVSKELVTAEPPAQVVQNHIRRLHEYNEIRDIGQGLIGMVAENRGGERVADMYEEFGLALDD